MGRQRGGLAQPNMRICSKCKEEKSEESFDFRNRLIGTRNSYCRPCRATYHQEYYTKNKSHLIAEAKRNKAKSKERARTFRDEYLSNHPCVDCGEPDLVVLEFDHVRGKKDFSVSYGVVNAYGVKRLRQEVAKCEVRCANCHRRRTMGA